jgi:hypothetical protein
MDNNLSEKLREYYLRRHEAAKDTSNKEIHSMVMLHKYGAIVKGTPIVINWPKVFEENMCPSCRGLLSLKEKEYECPKCRFKLPVELFDRAHKGHDQRKQLRIQGQELLKEAENQGFSADMIEEIRIQTLDEIKKKAQDDKGNE